MRLDRRENNWMMKWDCCHNMCISHFNELNICWIAFTALLRWECPTFVNFITQTLFPLSYKFNCKNTHILHLAPQILIIRIIGVIETLFTYLVDELNLTITPKGCLKFSHLSDQLIWRLHFLYHYEFIVDVPVEYLHDGRIEYFGLKFDPEQQLIGREFGCYLIWIAVVFLEVVSEVDQIEGEAPETHVLAIIEHDIYYALINLVTQVIRSLVDCLLVVSTTSGCFKTLNLFLLLYWFNLVVK